MAKRKQTKGNSSKTLKETVKKLHALMKKENLYEVELDDDSGFFLNIQRSTGLYPSPGTIMPSAPAPVQDEEEAEEDTKDYIQSPMNGIFYRAPSPGADNFVDEGSEISVGTTVCIIEAMKLMNEVQVERPSIIKKAIAKNGSAVKVGEPLFEIEVL